MQKIKATGTRTEVYKGLAKHTSGGLKKNDLIKGGGGKIVSRRASAAAKKNNNLVGAGYVTKKGVFGSVYDPEKAKVTGKSSPKKGSAKKSGIKKKVSPSPSPSPQEEPSLFSFF
jgi:hypothetical protein